MLIKSYQFSLDFITKHKKSIVTRLFSNKQSHKVKLLLLNYKIQIVALQQRMRKIQIHKIQIVCAVQDNLNILNKHI